ncbi:MAG: CoA-binding protein [Bacteriovoracaceae bacterium]|nr:CoA-binding protein [Bacteriovoracaceae bacterium]
MKKEVVAILGASDKSERYSYKAMKMLKEHGHETRLVSPQYDEIEGEKVYKKLSELKNIDTLTMYVNAQISNQLKDEIIQLNPKRVIFNPGTENISLERDLSKNKIEVEEACTLVLLSTGQF